MPPEGSGGHASGGRSSGGAGNGASVGGSVSGSGSSSGSGGAAGDASGGAAGDGSGGEATGGSGTGGDFATGGDFGTGGDPATGGSGSGGDSATGGSATGGSATGGSATGGSGTGGSGTGGATGCIACGTTDCGSCPTNTMIYVATGDYWIDATEVTNTAYASFLQAGPSLSLQPAECAFNGTYVPTNSWPATDRPNDPVAWVDWCDAYAYCAWAGKRLCGAIDGGPSPYASFKNAAVNQWYNACSEGGALTYPYGATYDMNACNGGDLTRNPWNVGSQSSCEGGLEGLYDMSGNVWEWEDSCAASTGQTDYCRARGGSFWSSESTLRCQAATSTTARSAVNRNLGFRCCADGE
jgi:hypothetical protein